MKNNKDLLDIYLGGNMNVGTLTPSAIYDIMASAQVEAIKEVVKHYHDNFWKLVVEGSVVLKSVDEIALELIKEIES